MRPSPILPSTIEILRIDSISSFPTSLQQRFLLFATTMLIIAVGIDEEKKTNLFLYAGTIKNLIGNLRSLIC